MKYNCEMNTLTNSSEYILVWQMEKTNKWEQGKMSTSIKCDSRLKCSYFV